MVNRDGDGFDAYYRWLGIPPEDQPPNLYRLLGIPLFEANPDVIEAAADRQMGHLRTYQTGPHSALSQKLLNEVAAARVCLLDPQRKAAYDAELKSQLSAGTRRLPPPLPPPPPRLVPMPVAEPEPTRPLPLPAPEPVINGQAPAARYRRRSLAADVIAASCVAALLVGWAVLFLSWADQGREVSFVGGSKALDLDGRRDADFDVHLPTGDGQPEPSDPKTPEGRSAKTRLPGKPVSSGPNSVASPRAAPSAKPTAGAAPAAARGGPQEAEPEDLFARQPLPSEPNSSGEAWPVPRPTTFNIPLPDGSAFSDAHMRMTVDALETLFPETASVCVFRFPRGQLKAVFSHQYGKLHGPSASLYESGTLCSVAFFKDGLRDGPLRLWEEGRRRLLYAEYRLGNEHGTTCLFKDDLPWYIERWTRGFLSAGYLVRFVEGKWIAVPAQTLTDEQSAQEIARATAQLQQLREQVLAGEKDAKKSVDAWHEQMRREAAKAYSLQARQAIINRMKARQAEENAQMQQMWRTALRFGLP